MDDFWAFMSIPMEEEKNFRMWSRNFVFWVIAVPNKSIQSTNKIWDKDYISIDIHIFVVPRLNFMVNMLA